MNIYIKVTFFLSAKSPNAKSNTFNKIKRFIEEIEEVSVDFIDKENVCLKMECDEWEKASYPMLKLCQSLGRKWIITGNIDFEFNGWTNEPLIVGVESINIESDNPKFNN